MKVFGVDYKFLACGDVFTQGLVHAAEDLGIDYRHSDWGAHNLPQQVKAFSPDLLFVVHGRKFKLRWPKLATEYRSAIWLLDEPYEVDDTANFSKQFAHVFVNDPATLARHHRASYLPVCYDPHLHYPHITADGVGRAGVWPVGFIGGGNGTRDRYLAALAAKGLLSYVIGGPWIDKSLQKICKSRNIPAAQTPDWYRSTRIVLNVFREKHHYNRLKTPATSLNPRVYEALACGALVVSEWRPEVDTLVPDLPTFKTIDECVGLVSDLLADPDRSEAIRLRCLASITTHTYASRLSTVLETIGLTGGSIAEQSHGLEGSARDSAAPITASRDRVEGIVAC